MPRDIIREVFETQDEGIESGLVTYRLPFYTAATIPKRNSHTVSDFLEGARLSLEISRIPSTCTRIKSDRVVQSEGGYLPL
jgi:hypothetical protein